MYCDGEVSAILLGALYLRGAPRSINLSSKRWPLIDSAIRRRSATLETAAKQLQHEGLWGEAMVVQQHGLLGWAESMRHAFVAAVDSGYPARLLARAPHDAPPVFWRSGVLPDSPLLGIVGSRCAPPHVLQIATEIGVEAKELGLAVVSGGAVGCDTAGVQLVGAKALEILPYGIALHRSDKPALSLCEPDEPFSRASAMERNALIYMASEQSVVIESRFQEGGTWFGATEALRRRLCPLLVRVDMSSQACRALLALGAKPICSPDQLRSVLNSCGPQPALIS